MLFFNCHAENEAARLVPGFFLFFEKANFLSPRFVIHKTKLYKL